MIYLVGAAGFVGSAFARYWDGQGIPYAAITRGNYQQFVGQPCDILVHAAGNSKTYLADQRPLEDFSQSVALVLRTIEDFRPGFYVLISSVDIYPDLSNPANNHEQASFSPLRSSVYGFHKHLAELVAQKHAPRWLITRLAGMIGPGLKKNPVYDILHRQPLRIHPDSQYQFMSTDAVAQAIWQLVRGGYSHDCFNICGSGTISPRQIGALARMPLDTSLISAETRPRVVHISTEKINSIVPMPNSYQSVDAFIRGQRSGASA